MFKLIGILLLFLLLLENKKRIQNYWICSNKVFDCCKWREKKNLKLKLISKGNTDSNNDHENWVSGKRFICVFFYFFGFEGEKKNRSEEIDQFDPFVFILYCVAATVTEFDLFQNKYFNNCTDWRVNGFVGWCEM